MKPACSVVVLALLAAFSSCAVGQPSEEIAYAPGPENGPALVWEGPSFPSTSWEFIPAESLRTVLLTEAGARNKTNAPLTQGKDTKSGRPGTAAATSGTEPAFTPKDGRAWVFGPPEFAAENPSVPVWETLWPSGTNWSLLCAEALKPTVLIGAGAGNRVRAGLPFSWSAVVVWTNASPRDGYWAARERESAAAPKALKPGVYEAEPYTCIVVVPGPHPDDKSVVGLAPTPPLDNMAAIKPEVRLVPRKGN